jgi:N-acetylglucosaminyldiphosphoundecaprenol N-acetyl-beta-D-mannosaminyltransferase
MSGKQGLFRVIFSKQLVDQTEYKHTPQEYRQNTEINMESRRKVLSNIMKSTKPRRFSLGGVDCSTHTIPQLLDELRELLGDKQLQPRTVLTVNAHIYNRAVEDSVLRRNINASRIVTADGMGIVWAARLFGVRIPERCNMTEAFRAFLTAPNMPAINAILIGCSPEEAEAATAEIHRISKNCHVVAAFSGYLGDADYRKICLQHQKADFILLGMGSPRTEAVTALATELCPKSIVWGIGGGTVLILAGKMREAPVVWRRLGLQWLFRLLCNPVKLWRRFIIGNPLFVWRILKAVWGNRSLQ